MNQILSVEYPKKEKKVKNKGPIAISTILRFFSISILIFGILMIGSGSYSMYKEAKSTKAPTKPTIYVEDVSDAELKVQVTHDKELAEVQYQWNGKNPVKIDANGKKKVEQTIKIPSGENTLTIYAKDINGQEISYPRTYTRKSDININFEIEESKLKVTAEGKEKLSYMTFRWDEEEEKTIEINDMKTEQMLNIPKGLHKLTISVVDVNNKSETKEQEVKGVTKPKLEVTTDGSSNFIIKASDEEGIKRVEFIINETDKNFLDLDKVLPIEQRKEFEYKYPLHDGQNKLKITVYNESGISQEEKVLVNK